MIEIAPLSNTKLQPIQPPDILSELALKYFVLFSTIDNKTHICLTESKMGESLHFLAKYNLDYPVTFLDQDSFEQLYNRFLEIKTDNEMTTIVDESEEESKDEDEFSLSDMLRNQDDLLNSEESAPIIKFVNSLFYQAIKKRASDIHIEIHENRGIVRFRVDGALSKYVELDMRLMSLVVSRIKVISNLDISEKRVTQDGRTQVKIAGKMLDIRVSVLPSFYGERVVMRILMQSEDIPHMPELGFEQSLVDEFDVLLKHSHGIILVTGPTGSGKSTTLHSFLQEVATDEKNVITVEDPVEYKADNINQIQANPKVGLTFAAGLRSILRQDPDVIMIGEIRDGETASIAIQAALTGHLVFSTLHTNNATAAITRLVDMGIEKFLVSSSILGVLAQRLVRKLCNECKEEDLLGEEYSEEFGILKEHKIYKSKGCSVCNHTGYIGRQAIGELFLMNEKIQEILKDNPDDNYIRSYVIKNGMRTLQDQLKQMVIDGITSIDEAIRVGIKD